MYLDSLGHGDPFPTSASRDPWRQVQYATHRASCGGYYALYVRNIRTLEPYVLCHKNYLQKV